LAEELIGWSRDVDRCGVNLHPRRPLRKRWRHR